MSLAPLRRLPAEPLRVGHSFGRFALRSFLRELAAVELDEVTLEPAEEEDHDPDAGERAEERQDRPHGGDVHGSYFRRG